MTAKRAATWIYMSSVLLGPACLWLFGDVDERFLQYILFYELLPLAAVALALAATRRDSAAPPALEIVVAALWCATHVAFCVWYPLTNSLERIGRTAIDGMAILLACAALGLAALAVTALVACWRAGLTSGSGHLLAALGTGALAAYLGRASVFFYASTRVTPSGGLAAISREMALRLLLTLVVVVALGSSAIVASIQSRRQAA